MKTIPACFHLFCVLKNCFPLFEQPGWKTAQTFEKLNFQQYERIFLPFRETVV